MLVLTLDTKRLVYLFSDRRNEVYRVPNSTYVSLARE